VSFSGNILLQGNKDDVFIFKVGGNMLAAANSAIVLQGIQPFNVIWRITGFLHAEPGAHLSGTFHVKTHAAFQTGSSLYGRVLAQTAITLDKVNARVECYGPREFIPIVVSGSSLPDLGNREVPVMF
jgi:hypothetical protein